MFIQGGQRWESIRLLTDDNATFEEVGLIPTTDIKIQDEFTGSFDCSNDLYNETWKLGANAAVAACVDAHSQPDTWEISNQGAYFRGQKPSINVLGIDMDVGTLTFFTKIARGGTGWSFGQPLYGEGIQLLLTSIASVNTFINQNETLIPFNSLVLAYGFLSSVRLRFRRLTSIISWILSMFEKINGIQLLRH